MTERLQQGFKPTKELTCRLEKRISKNGNAYNALIVKAVNGTFSYEFYIQGHYEQIKMLTTLMEG